MRVLIFHGYLLRGTGSNVYNASLAQALAGMGHEVHLLCQDRAAAELPWVASVGGAGSPGTVTVHSPEIGRILPVYVADSYEGFEAKPFAELTDGELDAYLDANVAAVRAVVERAGSPDAALANHLVMGPAILARAGLGAGEGGPGFAVKIHGSALEYTVKPHMDRFGPFAREGLAAASGVLVGSRHTAESLWEAMDDAHLPARTRLGPPGVDTDLFPLLPARAAVSRARDLASDLGGEAQTHHPRVAGPVANTSWGRDPGTAADAIEWFADAEAPRITFVGKLIVSKGVDLLLAAWPWVHAANPGARLLVVGFGEYREALQRLWMALTVGETRSAGEIARRGRALEGGPEGELAILAGHLDAVDDAYLRAAAEATGSRALRGTPRARRGRQAGSRGRRPRLPEHLSRGVRHGRGGGCERRRPARRGRPLRDRGGEPGAGGGPARGGGRARLVRPRRRSPPGDRRAPEPLARAREADSRARSGGAAGHRRAPVELGRGGARDHRGLGRAPRRPAAGAPAGIATEGI